VHTLNKKSLIALSLTVSTVAMAEMQPIDDAKLSEITGQAGITVELESNINIGEVRYTDTNSGTANEIGGGSLSAQTVSIGGANKTSFFGLNSWGVTATDKLDNIKIIMDIASDGDLIINMGPAATFGVIDFQVGIDKVELQGLSASTTLLSNFNLVGLIGAASLIIDTEDSAINVVSSIAIDDLDVDVDFLSLGLKDIQVTGTSFNPRAPQQLRAFFELDFKVYSTANARREALAIDFNNIEVDVRVGAIELGGNSIGSVFVDDLVISQTHMELYGH